jgi:hypothetical protein
MLVDDGSVVCLVILLLMFSRERERERERERDLPMQIGILSAQTNEVRRRVKERKRLKTEKRRTRREKEVEVEVGGFVDFEPHHTVRISDHFPIRTWGEAAKTCQDVSSPHLPSLLQNEPMRVVLF